MVILLSGMVFVSRGFTPGSVGYQALVGLVTTIVFTSTSAFIVFVLFEVRCGVVWGMWARCRSAVRQALWAVQGVEGGGFG